MNWADFNRTNFRVVFRAVITIMALIFSGFFMWKISFVPEGEVVSEHGKVVLGAILTVIITALINFYFGGNDDAESKATAIGSTGDGLPDKPVPDGLSPEREDVSGDGT